MSRAGSAAATVFSYALHTRLISFALKGAAVLRVSGKKLRRPCLDRFAVFAKASRIFTENAEQTSGRVRRGLSI